MKRKYLFEQESILLEINMTQDNNPVNYRNNSNSLLYIEIRSSEGDRIPHFHFFKNDNKEGCIRIDKAEYFNHKQYMQNVYLNSKEKYALDLWMKKICPFPDSNGKTNWEYMRDWWNNAHSIKINISEKPDYTKL